MPYLMQQDERGTTLQGWELRRKAMVFGRSEEADVQIKDDTMSRKHFRVEHRDDGHYVVDLGSTNGIRVNDRRTEEKALSPGDIVLAGHTKFLYEIGMSTMIGQAEEKSGRSLKSELKDMYKSLE